MALEDLNKDRGMGIFPHTLEKWLAPFRENRELFGEVRPLSDVEADFRNICRERNNEVNDLDNELEQLKESVSTAEKELDNLIEDEQKCSMMIGQQEKLFSEKAQEVKLKNNYKQQYKQRIMKATAKDSQKDLQLLDTYKKKLKAYQRLTGVVWEYSLCTDSTLHGYICDISDTKLKKFHLDIENKSLEQTVLEMWSLCETKSNSNESNGFKEFI